LLIGEHDKRMRQGLCHDINMHPYGGRRKIAIVDDADHFNTEGANCLLKTLEEPPSDSLLILIGTSLQRQLPTIRSRCQAILFRPLADDQVQRLLLRNGLVDSQDAAGLLSSRCGGSLAEAQLLSDPDVNEFRSCLLERISGPKLPIVELSKTCGTMIDSAGKDARVKRERAKLIFRISAAFYRELSLMFHARETGENQASRATVDAELKQALDTSSRFWKTGSQGATAAWNRCLLAMEQVDRNANQATLLESWSTDIARLSGC
jgi:DNA polymerase-3 subunit delta'